MEIDHLLSTTRAVRRKLDLGRPVEPAVLEECLNLALQAPTPGNAQAWRWLVVRDQDVKERLGALFREVGEAYLAGRVAAGEDGESRALASGRHLIDVIERVPVFVVPCLKGRPSGENATDAAFYGGIFPAVWNFQLALRSRGLGSTLTTYHLSREAEAAEILGVPDGFTQVGLLPVAYTTVPDFKPATRVPLSEVAYLDHWGTPLS
ncbi:nitroreductase family protein [Amycolatopsis sp., V23-08]|uniref:Nitroreductase family protein n=1 Tax=Amycolatopsis heterodermiae TaxID=3110235 RepID=A0ABU5RDI8_9PSEU|nr:nitroreductase family protein [Amycolatopsis sp., V23-08]MEA5363694.1 nitroreductase family protein [Amycolatopsis sp., V23-08]